MEARLRGEKELVGDCVAILQGERTDDATLFALAGPASGVLAQGGWGGVHGYWPRVWAMRSFLYIWDPEASGVVIAGAKDPHWRVREMAAKVVARRRLGDALEAMSQLSDDEVPRVREAAQRALVRLVEADA
ncbi:MAG TPA: HEAT repeat domain-containing protein [Acidimicrobiales bacterium]|nr:HEAT repeat domain-containing protein [Acidimicrobiales bacterium]